ncbi:MAG: hypothetical protein U9O85_10470 [Euryarchaeota archaeon]|nr:hypothetical protein [Euryarchaeota archaeon]
MNGRKGEEGKRRVGALKSKVKNEGKGEEGGFKKLGVIYGKMKKKVIIGTIFVVALLIAMTFVSTISATPEKPMEQWTQEHTVEVEHTTICKYEQGYLEIKEVYTGKDLEKKLGVDNLTEVLKIPVEAKVAEEIGVREGEEKVLVTEEEIVVTSEDDPPIWWTTYDYPQWAYKKILWFYKQEDPINLAWENTNEATVKSEILEEGWVNVSWSNFTEFTFYVSDPVYGWIEDEGVADDEHGWWGRYHTRLWQMSDGDLWWRTVVGQAHHDDPVFNWPPLHQADEYEPAEELVAGFYQIGWNVSDDIYWLDNEYTNPYGAYNNGWATHIVMYD